MTDAQKALEARLREWADMSEKSTAFMADPEMVEETTAEVALLREAAAALASPDPLVEALEYQERVEYERRILDESERRYTLIGTLEAKHAQTGMCPLCEHGPPPHHAADCALAAAHPDRKETG